MHCLVSDFAASTKHGDYENIPGSYAVSDPKDKSRHRLMYVTERDNATLRCRAGTTDATGRLPTTTVHDITMARKACCCRFRGDGLHPNIHYSTYKGAIAFSHNLIICSPKNGSAHESRHTFFCSPDPTKGTINNERSSKRRSAQDLLYVSITQKLQVSPMRLGYVSPFEWTCYESFHSLDRQKPSNIRWSHGSVRCME